MDSLRFAVWTPEHPKGDVFVRRADSEHGPPARARESIVFEVRSSGEMAQWDHGLGPGRSLNLEGPWVAREHPPQEDRTFPNLIIPGGWGEVNLPLWAASVRTGWFVARPARVERPSGCVSSPGRKGSHDKPASRWAVIPCRAPAGRLACLWGLVV
jgi:hypothetical protein